MRMRSALYSGSGFMGYIHAMMGPFGGQEDNRSHPQKAHCTHTAPQWASFLQPWENLGLVRNGPQPSNLLG